MSVAHNTMTSSTQGWGNQLSFAHTPSGSDKLLIVSIAVYADSVTIDDVEYDGVAMTELVNTSNGSRRVAIYYLVNPSASGNIVIDVSTDTTLHAIANSYSGVDQSTPLGTHQTDSDSGGANTSIDVVLSSATDEICFDSCFRDDSPAPIIDAGQTARGATVQNSTINCSEEVGASSVTMSWTFSAWSGNNTMQVGFAIKPAGATLLPNKLNQGQAIDNLTLVQQHTLAINPISQAQAIDNLTPTQANILVVNDIAQSQAIDNISLIQAHNLDINSSDQNQNIDSLNLIQQHLLAINDLAQGQGIDNLDLQAGLFLNISSINQDQSVNNLDLIQSNILNINGVDQPQTIENISLGVGTILQIAELAQAQNIDQINIIQQNVLIIGDITTPQSIQNLILDTGILLGIADIIQNQAIDSLSLTQSNILAIDQLEQGQVIDNVVFSQVAGRLVITLTIKSPGVSTTIKSPGISLDIE